MVGEILRQIWNPIAGRALMSLAQILTPN